MSGTAISSFSYSLANLARMMPAVQPVEFPPLVDGQGAEDGVIHEFRACAESTIAFFKSLGHALKLRRDSVPYLFGRHVSWYSKLRSFSSSAHISQIDGQQRGKTVLQRGPRRERRIFLQTSRNYLVGAFVGQKKMFQDLRGIPLSLRSLQQIIVAGAPCCIFEFLL